MIHKSATTGSARPIGRVVLDVVFPPVCPGCGVLLRHRGVLCRTCSLDDDPLPSGRRIEAGITAVGPYDGPWRHALHRLKYDGSLAWAGPLGRRLAAASVFDEPWDRIVAVPLHWRRRLVRGFNQVEVILGAVARERPEIRGRIDKRVLKRRFGGAAQRAKVARERKALDPGCFSVPSRIRATVSGQRILVVDDVVTTGATLRGAMAALREAGAAEVRGLALLRAV